MGTEEPGGRPTLRCARCGERLVRRRSDGPLVHAPRVVAACDLDSDHPVAPDWEGLGPVPCRRCGALAAADPAGAFSHLEPGRDDDHAPDPAVPGLPRVPR